MAGLERRLNWPALQLLPLDEAQLRSLLGRYQIGGLERYLDSALQELLQTPDLLSALALSWRQATSTNMPRNMGEIYELYIDRHLFAEEKGRYDYWRVKRPVLAFIAYTMIAHERSNWHQDQDLETQILAMLGELDEFYRRRSRVMPEDWNVQDLLEELDASPVLAIEQRGDGTKVMTFSKAGYRDYYTAVHIARQEERDEEIFRSDQDTWLPVLLILAGITPAGNELFDRIYGSQPALAADLWLENRPFGLQAPGVIQTAVAEQEARLGRAFEEGFYEPLTTKLLLRLLNAADLRERLQAVGALTQWGRPGIGPLLDAVQDDHPLLAATAKYALLHLGESILENGRVRPVPPLFQAPTSFHSVGGCRAVAGPLTFNNAPRSLWVKLKLHVEQWDIDLFEQAAEIEVWSMPPEWFVAGWLEGQMAVDWPLLLARLRHVASLAFEVQTAIRQRRKMPELAAEFDERGRAYTNLAYFLARDLGLSDIDDYKPGVDEDTDHAEKIYGRLRYLYSLSNRERFMAPSGQANVIGYSVDLSVESAAPGATVTGISAGSIGSGTAESPKDQFKQLSIAISAEEVVQAAVSGLLVEEMVESGSSMPLLTRVDLALNVEQAQGAIVTGVGIGTLRQAAGGILFDLQMNIGQAAGGKIVGVDVGQVEPGKIRDRQS